MHGMLLALWLAAGASAQQQEDRVCFYDSQGRYICVTQEEWQRILEGKMAVPEPAPTLPSVPSSGGDWQSCAAAPPAAGETTRTGTASGLETGASAYENDFWKYPLEKQWHVSSDFGWRTLNGKKDWHSGLDIGCYSWTAVYAARPGVVHYAGPDTGFGKVVVLLHSDGSKSWYGHLNEWLVKKGDVVGHSTVIGKSGNTGHSYAAHLHFEVHDAAGKAVDPAPLLGLSIAKN